MSSTSVHHCVCPQETAARNHKIQTDQWWKDPAYRELSDQFLKDNPVCEYCGGKSSVVHHDNARSYLSKEEYFKPENFTPACARCHHEYRTGKVLCPVCGKHYIQRDGPHDRCKWCRGIMNPGMPWKYRYKSKYPCARRVGNQRCLRDGRVFVCARSSRDACGCDYFKARTVPI